MSESAATRPSLLVRVRNPQDDLAWAQFVDIYGPVIYGFSRKNGLQDADAADITQDVLKSISQALRSFEYDPKKGTFRRWLFTAVRNKIRTFWQRQQRRELGSGDTEVQHILEQQPQQPEELWDQEYERRLLHWAAEQVRPNVTESSWQAFWLTGVEGKAPKETAAELGLSVAAVYMAKSRVMAQIKDVIREVQEAEDG